MKPPREARRQCKSCTSWFDSGSKWDTLCEHCAEREVAPKPLSKYALKRIVLGFAVSGVVSPVVAAPQSMPTTTGPQRPPGRA